MCGQTNPYNRANRLPFRLPWRRVRRSTAFNPNGLGLALSSRGARIIFDILPSTRLIHLLLLLLLACLDRSRPRGMDFK
jgi:hypothetical protein